MNTEDKIKEYRAALQKVVDDSEIGCVPASHIARIKRMLAPEPKILYVNEYNDGFTVYENKDRAHSVTDFNRKRTAVPYIELTEEVKQKLNIK